MNFPSLVSSLLLQVNHNIFSFHRPWNFYEKKKKKKKKSIKKEEKAKTKKVKPPPPP